MAPPFRRGPVPQTAIDYVAGKQLRPSFDWREAWQQEHATAFVVAKATTDDVLSSIQESLVEALAAGTPFKKWSKDLTPILQAEGWWGRAEQVDPTTQQTVEVQLGSPARLKVIYDANMRTARAVGEWSRIQATKDDLPYLQYELGPSIRHRELHLTFEGKILRVDDPWWSAYFPPNGWGCKCRTRQLDQAEADSLGGVQASPPIQYVPWVNQRTGETLQVPAGADPGWGNNAGADGLRQRRDLVAEADRRGGE